MKIRIPAQFYFDHRDRGLPTPADRTPQQFSITVDTDDPAFQELLDDAKFYDNNGRGGTDYLEMNAAARRLLKAVAREVSR